MRNYGEMTKYSQSDYNQFKSLVKRNLKIFKMPCKHISLDGQYLKYDDGNDSVKFGLTNSSYNTFLNIIGRTAMNKIRKSYDVDGKNKNVISNTLINQFIKTSVEPYMYFTINGNQTIVNVSLTSEYITIDQYFKTIDQTLNTYKNLEIDQMGMANGKINIGFRTPNGFRTQDKDMFLTGFGMSWDNKMTQEDYISRLVCSNGMRINTKHNVTTLKHNTNENWKDFMTEIAHKSKTGFKNQFIIDRLDVAKNTTASLYELENLLTFSKKIGKDSKIDYNINNLNGINIGQVQSNFEQHFNMAEMSNMEKRRLKTPFKVMDLVNKVTDLGSHDYITKNSNYDMALLKYGGDLIMKNLDLEGNTKQIY